ncbi:PAS domain-containing protein [bacterium]|nr:PAS domain-containing protein [bacterium]
MGADAAHAGEELRLLLEAFERFSGAGEAVSRSYEELTAKIDELNLQLEEKNRELADNLAEKERLSTWLASVLESLGTGVLVVDREGVVEMANRAAALLLSPGGEALANRPLVEAVGGPAHIADLMDDLLAARRRTREREFETNAGGARRVLRASCHPMIGGGAAGSRVVLISDITSEADIRHENERTGRLAAMGEMAVQIVHQVRNPMGSIELVASLLSRDLAGDPDKRQMVERIRSGIRSMNHFIDNLLAFARDTQPSAEPVRLPVLLAECLGYFTHLTEAQGVAVAHDYPDELAPIDADPNLLKQVFMNLILNAVQAMPEGGALSLSIEQGRRADFATGGEADYTRVSVRDTGCGIEPETRAKIFHPFFSTKERGTGLGLALAHNIVKAHGGSIDIESEPGRGSCFTVNLPRRRAGATEAA